MTRRVLTFFAMLLVALTAFAGENRDRDILLTPDGILYTVETAHDQSATYGNSAWFLSMSVHQGDSHSTFPVPGSLIGGAHSNPALGYDPESRTLFLFWQESLNGGLSSRLLFSSYHDGRWSDTQALDSVDWNLRRNLRIAVTRTAETIDNVGRRVPMPFVFVHAVWWEETGYGEWARYALLGIENGIVTSKDIRFVGEFAGMKFDQTQQVLRNTADEIVRHPAVAAVPTRDSVDVVFGDAKENSMRRVRIKPVVDGRLRIPIGVRETNLRHAELNMTSNSRASAVVNENDLAFFAVSKKSVDYVIYRDGSWTTQRTIALTDDLSAETAVEALRRLVAEQ
ncbi:MAG TPA: hypothetical protein VFL80_06110 [Thermoanaerobaculia bacterium]|nr:hypothetical protein [Thermoanaerobaculia bacterium]